MRRCLKTNKIKKGPAYIAFHRPIFIGVQPKRDIEGKGSSRPGL
jgi:hypothetical protein